MALSAELLATGKLFADTVTAATALEKALSSGAAADRFARMVVALGGPADLLERPNEYLRLPPVSMPVAPTGPGFVAAVDTRAIGLAIVGLGGGRTRADQSIDHAVGITEVAPIGAEVGPDRPLCVVHARTADGAARAAAEIRSAVTIADAAPELAPVVAERIAS